MALNVTLYDDGVRKILDALPQTIFQAQRSAIGRTTTWAKKELQNRMRTKTGLPAKAFRQFRVKAKHVKETGTVWIGLEPIKARYAGKLKQDTGGAWAGQYYFAGGFVARMNSGTSSIYKRKGRKRFPIVEQTVDIKAGFEVAEGVAREAENELRSRFASRLRELNPGIQ